VQVVIALIITPEGFPLAYEVLAETPSDKNYSARVFEEDREEYGKAERIWVMDRGSRRGGFGGDAAERSAGLLFGGDAQRATEPIREGADGEALA